MISEIEGDPNQSRIWEGKTGCPASGEMIKSPFCRHRAECELLTIQLRAETQQEAEFFVKYAEVEGKIPDCLSHKPFLTSMRNTVILLQPI